MAKVESSKNTVAEPSCMETLVIGAGAAGTIAARKLQEHNPGMQILMLEAEDRLVGRMGTGLHLCDAQASAELPLVRSKAYGSALVRWERSWISPEEVDWSHKEWLGRLPQWKSYLSGEKVLVSGIHESELGIAIRDRCPVRRLSPTSDSKYAWRLETPNQVFLAEHVVWAAGLVAFQNAFGKQEAQSFMVGNPSYTKEAADFRGGLALELTVPSQLTFEAGFDPDRVFALPFKHAGLLYLMLGVFESPSPDSQRISVLVHAHRDLWAEPKEALSLQKSIRRALKHSFFDDAEIPKGHAERWILEERVGGHLLGTPWLLGAGQPGLLEFVGDETLAAAQHPSIGSVGALMSVDSLTFLKVEKEQQAHQVL